MDGSLEAVSKDRRVSRYSVGGDAFKMDAPLSALCLHFCSCPPPLFLLGDASGLPSQGHLFHDTYAFRVETRRSNLERSFCCAQFAFPYFRI
ncbi:hypothetical protein MPTK1_3g24650 [Marchantia polymorpha subsp. ruderalis]|uniref:Uncharacterized protein n=2 Tax=Marchantia polymorpha TaxID=3197 RepID=A0AAF6B4E9_MARPO|nr:hypothetical protein MARPO_0224s0009 [Marchantia polymorpha]BBN06883.1 hypothetical protein Mp_3g24650 [Marchantia polymorpha subsp. ruderalis]|eukprot:PTQ27094.1 hypothetical protein MARPO_0224s0009 [Marchantia polymorpha]